MLGVLIMAFDINKFNTLNSVNADNFTDYDLDYLRMQIKKNSESLEKSIQNLKRLANRTDTQYPDTTEN